ncbi:MAG: exo-alpha-sialidase [Acidobacteria bacterium]|nr:exo-alpha-sialidase [Acidobacteriota bacterium]
MSPRQRTGAVAAALAAMLTAPAAAENGVVLAEFIFNDAPHPECHASTIAETASGALVAAWFGGTAERNADVGIWFSRLGTGGWTVPVEVANGVQRDGVRYPTWNPVLYQSPRDGAPLLLFYKVGPSPPEWWGMVMESEDDGRTWSEPRRLPDGILGPIKNKPITLADGSLLAGSSIEDAPDPPAWRAHFERSTDLGRNWTRTDRLAGKTATGEDFWIIQPTIFTLGGGELLAMFRSKQSCIAASRSADDGRTWGPIYATGLLNPDAGVDGLTLADGRHLLVYNHKVRRNGAWAGSRSRLNVALSDDGETWDASLMLEDQDGEYSYPAVIQTGDGRVHVTYTHRRTRIRHFVLDPAALPRYPMPGIEWPSEAPVLSPE